MNLSLATTPEEFRDLALAAIDVFAQYYRELSNMPVMPVTTALALAAVQYMRYVFRCRQSNLYYGAVSATLNKSI